jgi:hypothetical protein
MTIENQDAIIPATSSRKENYLLLTIQKLRELEKQSEGMDLQDCVKFLRMGEYEVLERLQPDLMENEYIVSHGYTEKGVRHQWALSMLIELMLKQEDTMNRLVRDETTKSAAVLLFKP